MPSAVLKEQGSTVSAPDLFTAQEWRQESKRWLQSSMAVTTEVKNASIIVTWTGWMVECLWKWVKLISRNLKFPSSLVNILILINFPYIFEEISLKINILCEKFGKPLNLFLLKCKNKFWVYLWPWHRLSVQCSTVGIPSISCHCAYPLVLEEVRGQTPQILHNGCPNSWLPS